MENSMTHPFKDMNPSFSEAMVDLLTRCADDAGLDKGALTIKLAGGGATAFYNPEDHSISIGVRACTYLSDDDLEFVVHHEMRHAVQFRDGLLSVDMHEDGRNCTHKWHTGETFEGVDTQSLMVFNNEAYHQLPWESDANGYAFEAMGGYVPSNPGLASGVKFMTKPESKRPAVRRNPGRRAA